MLPGSTAGTTGTDSRWWPPVTDGLTMFGRCPKDGSEDYWAIYEGAVKQYAAALEITRSFGLKVLVQIDTIGTEPVAQWRCCTAPTLCRPPDLRLSQARPP
jgi:hypothetical protein